MNCYPLFYKFKSMIIGEDFSANIDIKGRVLLKKEYEEYWMYGVNPGGIAGHGKTQKEAFDSFNVRLKKVIIDIVSDCKNYDDFESQLKKFVNDICTLDKKDWDIAREQIREKIKKQEPIDNKDIKIETLDRDKSDGIKIIVKRILVREQEAFPKEKVQRLLCAA